MDRVPQRKGESGKWEAETMLLGRFTILWLVPQNRALGHWRKSRMKPDDYRLTAGKARREKTTAKPEVQASPSLPSFGKPFSPTFWGQWGKNQIFCLLPGIYPLQTKRVYTPIHNEMVYTRFCVE